jgi:hypothetical protein
MGRGPDDPEEESLLDCTSGVAYVEYVVLLCLVTVIGSVAVYSIGAPLLQTFRYAQLLIALPIP